jgi:hypothetical protein
MAELTELEIDEARRWWRNFPDANKGQFSIWKILALYGKHVLATQTVHFDGDKKTAEM